MSESERWVIGILVAGLAALIVVLSNIVRDQGNTIVDLNERLCRLEEQEEPCDSSAVSP